MWRTWLCVIETVHYKVHVEGVKSLCVCEREVFSESITKSRRRFYFILAYPPFFAESEGSVASLVLGSAQVSRSSGPVSNPHRRMCCVLGQDTLLSQCHPGV